MKLTRVFSTVLAVVPGTGVSSGALGDEAEGVTVSVLAGATSLEDLDNESHVQFGLGYRFDNPWGIEAV